MRVDEVKKKETLTKYYIGIYTNMAMCEMSEMDIEWHIHRMTYSSNDIFICYDRTYESWNSKTRNDSDTIQIQNIFINFELRVST